MYGEGIDMSTMRKTGHFMEVSRHFSPSLWTINELTSSQELLRWSNGNRCQKLCLNHLCQ